jgi:fermentation-respiration switch protein FrsA (DUF1100 family)
MNKLLAKFICKKMMGKPVKLIKNPIPYKKEDVTVQSGKYTLRGEAYIPQDSQEKRPAIIISHGFGSGKIFETSPAISLAQAGIVSFIFDFAGGSSFGSSDGKMTEMSVLTEKADLLNIIDYVRQRADVDVNNLFLMGESQGGFVSTLAGAERPDQIKAMVLYFPAFLITESSYDRFPQGQPIPDEYDVIRNHVGKIYDIDARKVDIYAEMKKYEKPVLILHGDKDTLVPMEYSNRAIKAFPNANLIVMKGQSHGFNQKGRKKAYPATYDFIKNNISK